MILVRYHFFIVLIFISQGLQAASGQGQKISVTLPPRQNSSQLQASKSIDNWVVVDDDFDWDETDVPLIAYTGTAFPTLSSWSDSCKKQPQNRPVNVDQNGKVLNLGKFSGFATLGQDKAKQWKEFESVLLQWLEMKRKGSLSQQDLWEYSNVGKVPEAKFFDVTQSGFFIPFAQKIIAQPQDEFYIRGDLHGDIYSLLIQLETMRDAGVLDDSFKILKNNVRIVFLGDYVDRGQYGCEVLYTMLRLSLENPERVIFVRGNHEDIMVSSRDGFKTEVAVKFDDVSGLKHKLISRMNDFLPVVLYIGCKDVSSSVVAKNQITNYLQCCHGGLEVGYDPKFFLDNTKTVFQMIGLLTRAIFIKKFQRHCNQSVVPRSMHSQGMVKWWDHVGSHVHHNGTMTGPGDLGLMWNDFDINNDDQVSFTTRGMMYGELATEKILELQSSNSSKICGVFRGHQHGDPDMMNSLKRCKGVYKLWSNLENDLAPHFRTIHDGKVWTFNVGPDSIFGQSFGFNFDAYARLIVDERLQDWKMQVFNTTVVI